MWLTKKFIINAIKKEKVEQNAWVVNGTLPFVGDCRVCAVGAVLRSCGIENTTIKLLANKVSKGAPVSGLSKNEALLLLSQGNWAAALSNVFENGDSTPRNAKARAIRFVRNHFPAKVRLSRKDIRDARNASFHCLKNVAHDAMICAGFEYDVPYKHPDEYTPAERAGLVKAYRAWYIRENPGRVSRPSISY